MVAIVDRTPLVDRTDEQSTLYRMLDDVRRGESRALLVHGESGIGKTTLLAAVGASATDMRVLRCSGIESEASLAYAGLHQLLRPVAERISRLPSPHAAALDAVMGLGRGTGERFLVGVALIGLLADLADERPVLVIVDDAQWIDEASSEAIVFAARRFESEAVGVLLAAQDSVGHDMRGSGFPELTVRPLDRAATGQLLDLRAPSLAPDVRDRLLESSAGNPLAALELARGLTPDQRRGTGIVPGQLPIGSQLSDALAKRIERTSAPARRCLLLAALEFIGDRVPVLGAMLQLDIPVAALSECERAGLLTVDEDAIRFAHPLIRGVVLRGSTLAERIEAHNALAAALTGDHALDRRLLHLAAAATGPDDHLADAMDAAAQGAASGGTVTTAELLLERAARLTVDASARGRRLVEAARKALDAGRRDLAEGLVREAAMLPLDVRTKSDLGTLRAGLLFDSRSLQAGIDSLIEAADLVAATDPRAAARARLFATRMSYFNDDLPATARLAATISTLDLPHDDPLRALALAFSPTPIEPERGPKRYVTVLDALRAEGDELHPHLIPPIYVGDVFGEEESCLAFQERVVAVERERGAVGRLAWSLVALGGFQNAIDDWTGALISCSEGADLGRDTGQPTVVGRAAAVMSMVAAGQGRELDCRRLADETGAAADARGLRLTRQTATRALGRLDLGLGNADSAFARLLTLARGDPWPGSSLNALFATSDVLDAAVRTGRIAEARTILESFERWWVYSPPRWAQAIIYRTRATLARDVEEAVDLASRAVSLQPPPFRQFERARSQLVLGTLLRRARRRSDARQHLRAALETFEHLGATPWADRASADLRATGEAKRESDRTDALEDLTPQELQIARLAAQGMTNQEIAARLFLSHRTIGSHLYRLFPKLGITSRAELRSLDLKRAHAPGLAVESPQHSGRIPSARGRVIRLGVFPFMTDSHAVRRLIARFADGHPGYGIRLIQDWTPELVRRLGGGELDAALVAAPVSGGPYVVETLARQRLEAGLNRADPLSRLSEISAADLRDRAWLFPAALTQSGQYHRIREWFDENGVSPVMADLQGWVPGSTTALQAALRGERAFTIVMPAFASAPDYEIVRRPLSDGPIQDVLLIAMPDANHEAINELFSTVRAIAPDFIDPRLREVSIPHSRPA